jgi:oligosaccharide repeat unit polymerase
MLCVSNTPRLAKLNLYCFIFVFWGIIPSFEISNHTFKLNLNFSFSCIYKSQFIIILFLFVIEVIYYLVQKMLSTYFKEVINRDKYFLPSPKKHKLLFVIVQLILWGTGLTIARSTYFAIRGISSGEEFSNNLLWYITMGNLAIVLVFFLISNYFRQTSQSFFSSKMFTYDIYTFMFLLTIPSIIMVANPISQPRFVSAAVMFSVIIQLLLFSSTLCKQANSIIFLFLFALLTGSMNYLDMRYISNSSITNVYKDASQNIKDDYIFSGHYDAFTTFVMQVDYTHQHGHTFGRYLFFDCFFYIPRILYPAKPMAASAEIIQEYEYSIAPNISSPPLSEAYLDFGWIGVILFSVFFAMVLAWCDYVVNNMNNVYQYIGGIIFISFLQIFLRGSAVTALAPILCVIICLICMSRFFRINNNSLQHNYNSHFS